MPGSNFYNIKNIDSEHQMPSMGLTIHPSSPINAFNSVYCDLNRQEQAAVNPGIKNRY